MPTDEEILDLLPPSADYGISTWALAMTLRRSYPSLQTRALRARLEALTYLEHGASVQRRRANMILWERADPVLRP